jgi:hypothetical protein
LFILLLSKERYALFRVARPVLCALLKFFASRFGRDALSDKTSTAMNCHAKFAPRVAETEIGRALWKNYCVTRGHYPQNGYVFWQFLSVPDALRFTFKLFN